MPQSTLRYFASFAANFPHFAVIIYNSTSILYTVFALKALDSFNFRYTNNQVMKKFCLLIVIVLTTAVIKAQTIIHRDPLIERMVRDVSKDSLESYVKKL